MTPASGSGPARMQGQRSGTHMSDVHTIADYGPVFRALADRSWLVIRAAEDVGQMARDTARTGAARQSKSHVGG